ncbi:phosphatidate cytidylyltransferase, mitochondrial [Venturia canescens]|uniref:phosphatidate cytidylyltransferase, mitochondrial n=1 Tax=Venturia canescens TaxID=32260 RepID=UPI001C9D047F|nr:phosphatidate cytidylyltransferase, mitochondrial [Venturia canescens]
MMEKVVAPLSHYKKILKDFPRNMMFCFAYGSGAFKQKNDPARNMLDLVFVVRNSNRWHAENMKRNSHHYAQPLRLMGHKAVANFQETWGAKIYYNTLITSSEGRLIKYGVISEISLVEDLLDWDSLYLAGRLHKPVQILVEPDENSQIGAALVRNLHSAVHAALLLLPEHFTESDLYREIAGLSYRGDFRMSFGEDKNKIINIVAPQIANFRELYAPILKQFDKYIEIPKSELAAVDCHQDTSPAARIHHLNHLPRKPQVKLVRAWSQGPRSKDTEDCLRAIAHDPDCSELLDESLREIVWKSSVSQSLKGILTAGFLKSVRYSGAKISKMLASQPGEQNVLRLAHQSGDDKIKPIYENIVKKENVEKEIPK